MNLHLLFVPFIYDRNINIPWPSSGFGDADYLYAFTRLILPVAYEYDPDFVFGTLSNVLMKCSYQ